MRHHKGRNIFSSVVVDSSLDLIDVRHCTFLHITGWVMVTIMTAGLVVAIFAVFRGAIITAVKDAIDGVVSSTGG